MLHAVINRLGFYLTASALFMLLMLLAFTAFYHFTEGLNWLDSFYFTMITTRTIGFGDISPTTTAGKVGTIINALIPATVFLGASLVVLQTFMNQLQNHWRNYLMERNKNHDIIVSNLDILTSLIQEYNVEKKPFVLILNVEEDKIPHSLDKHLNHHNFLNGDATKDEVLIKAGVKRAKSIIIATEDDSFNMYVLVSAKSLNPNLRSIVRINHYENASKFISVGADTVLPASTVIGQMLSQASLNPRSHDFLVSLHTHTKDPFFEDIIPDKNDYGQKVRSKYKRAVALYRNNTFIFDLSHEIIKPEDTIIVINLQFMKD